MVFGMSSGDFLVEDMVTPLLLRGSNKLVYWDTTNNFVFTRKGDCGKLGFSRINVLCCVNLVIFTLYYIETTPVSS